jgi:ATP-dependent Lon protease
MYNKTAGEVIRDLETRIARLERQALFGFSKKDKITKVVKHLNKDLKKWRGREMSKPREIKENVFEGRVRNMAYKFELLQDGGVVFHLGNRELEFLSYESLFKPVPTDELVRFIVAHT